MAQRLKVERELEAKDRKSFDEFLRDQRPTVDEAWQWIVAAGYTAVSRSAVYGYMQSSESKLADLQLAAEAAAAWSNMARESGAVAFNEAALGCLSQRLMQTIFDMRKEGEVDAEELVKLSTALRNTTGTLQKLQEVREEERKAAEARATAALAKASEEVKGGATGAAVVATIKKAMGLDGGAK